MFQHHIPDQLLVSWRLTGNHRRFLHHFQGQQLALDFAQFDAEAADLHLMIDATQVIQGAVFTPAHQIAGAVHALPGCAKRIGREALGSQFRALEVTASQAHFAADIQLASHADGQQVEFGIENIEAARTDRVADGRVGRLEGVPRIGFPDQRGHHRLGRAVAIDDPLRLQHLLQALVGFAGKGFATQSPGTHRHSRKGRGGVASDGQARRKRLRKRS